MDKVAFITIGVDLWPENLDVTRGYQMEEVWREYRVYVERDNRAGSVNHFAGFLVVVDGKLKYLVVPTAERWAKPASVASIIYDIIRREVEGMRGGR